MRNLFYIGLLIMGLISPTFAGDKVGNGGDGTALEFKHIAMDLYDYFKTLPPAMLPEKMQDIDLLVFKNFIDNLNVTSKAQFDPPHENFTAMNFSYPHETDLEGGQIIINRSRWSEETQKKAVVLHELLGLMGKDRKYDVSHEFVNTIVDNEAAFSQIYDLIQGIRSAHGFFETAMSYFQSVHSGKASELTHQLMWTHPNKTAMSEMPKREALEMIELFQGGAREYKTFYEQSFQLQHSILSLALTLIDLEVYPEIQAAKKALIWDETVVPDLFSRWDNGMQLYLNQFNNTVSDTVMIDVRQYTHDLWEWVHLIHEIRNRVMSYSKLVTELYNSLPVIESRLYKTAILSGEYPKKDQERLKELLEVPSVHFIILGNNKDAQVAVRNASHLSGFEGDPRDVIWIKKPELAREVLEASFPEQLKANRFNGALAFTTSMYGTVSDIIDQEETVDLFRVFAGYVRAEANVKDQAGLNTGGK
ncbi:MAG: hypothetical protein A2Z91_07095 [Deltaproteobacteria bacterium GWA2_38_16]|nr:MAG: hypothetical protein A2Z91_07095 [Deltaproteobacteria bacterium GWA2_38_16]OGQ02364.1 MAG: hypothetical protein A3D19_05930 [Deltaproteobacteria bacterium RIFCSPHIGHO2_02_FULL_38_15]OGQ34442.1 MAG: hypothetical protein A3A72_01005 [Deltaproteobacteria bacterium RIFCSPLOWO2_01_FULL_38_9]OGQ63798.1 MAG: hypothetical protein A3G92_06720 [Deltaproteobacteria bacterium RIFCSPLOWO2_12_FULL_38_8]HBQ20697.1 hypothetical protein [Deltaproteobacteria bacterium]